MRKKTQKAKSKPKVSKSPVKKVASNLMGGHKDPKKPKKRRS